MTESGDYSTNVILDLVACIYDAISDPDRWQVFLERLANVLRAGGAWFMLAGESGLRVASASFGLTLEQIEMFNVKWGKSNPWYRRENIFAGFVGLTHEVCPDEQLEATPFYHEFLSRYEYYYGVVCFVLANPHSVSGLVAMRTRGRGPFNDADVQLLERLIPHLNRAARLQLEMNALRDQRDLAIESLDRFGTGMVLVDDDAAVLHLNAPAQQIVGLVDGVQLFQGKLRAANWTDEKQLRMALGRATTTARREALPPTDTLLLRRPSGKLPYCLTLSALQERGPNPFLPRRTAAAVLIRDLEQYPEPSRKVLAELFAFTPSECDMASHLAAGRDVEECCGRMNIRMHTARTHIKHMLSKTGQSRQAGLVSVLSRLTSIDSASPPCEFR